MSTAKIAITLDEDFLKEIDRWVSEGRYSNRSKAIQEILKEKITEAIFSGNGIWDEEVKYIGRILIQ